MGHGYGNVTFLESSYNDILTVCPQFGLVTPDNFKYPYEAALHESFVTDRKIILVTAYNATTTDLTSCVPKQDWVVDCLFFELDPWNGDIKSSAFDFFHTNSVVNIDESFLVNSRHL